MDVKLFEQLKIPNREEFIEVVKAKRLCYHCEYSLEKKVPLDPKLVTVYRPVYCKKHKKELELDKWHYDKHSEENNNCKDWTIKQSIITPPEWEVKLEQELRAAFDKGIIKDITSKIKKETIDEITSNNGSNPI